MPVDVLLFSPVIAFSEIITLSFALQVSLIYIPHASVFSFQRVT